MREGKGKAVVCHASSCPTVLIPVLYESSPFLHFVSVTHHLSGRLPLTVKSALIALS